MMSQTAHVCCKCSLLTLPQVEVIATYHSSVKAVNEIEGPKPDLVFLDREMPVINGFELLEKILHLNFSVIFITAHNQYARKAFRFNALNYLVKPIDTNDLIKSVAKAEKKIKPTSTQLILLQRQMRGETASKIGIPGQDGISFIELNEILFAKASNNDSKLIFMRREFRYF